VDILALLGDDARLPALEYQAISTLDLPIHARVGYRGPIHPYVVIVIEIQEFFLGELSVVVGYDGVGNSKMENDVLDEIHYLLGANLC
jgi:hypothetical protein